MQPERTELLRDRLPRRHVAGWLLLGAGSLFAGGCASAALSGGSELPSPHDAGDGDLFDFVTTPPSSDGSPAPVADLSTDPTTDGSIVPNVCGLEQIRINELATAGTGGASDEFVELYNPCSTSVALQGGSIVYRAASSSSDNFTFAAFTSQTIATHGYFVLGNTNFSGSANMKPFTGTGGMAAAGGGVALKDSSNNVVDSLGWGTATNAFVEGEAAGAPSTTQSVARKTDGVDTNDNVADFTLGKPTPGAAN